MLPASEFSGIPSVIFLAYVKFFVPSVILLAGILNILLPISPVLLFITSLNVSVVENIRGAASTVIELTVVPSSNDVVPVRDQILNIDTANSTITVEADTFVGGSADAGVGYTTTSSY